MYTLWAYLGLAPIFAKRVTSSMYVGFPRENKLRGTAPPMKRQRTEPCVRAMSRAVTHTVSHTDTL